MTRPILSNFTKFALGVAVLGLALLPKSARADVTYSFAGTALCDSAGGCGGTVAFGATFTVTGTYRFDDATESIGSWSFSLPNGVTYAGPSNEASVGDLGSSDDDLSFCQSSNVCMDLFFADPTDSGTLLTFEKESGFFDNTTGIEFEFLSGSATPQTTGVTPEPPSLLLLGTGLLGLGPFVRRFAKL